MSNKFGFLFLTTVSLVCSQLTQPNWYEFELDYDVFLPKQTYGEFVGYDAYHNESFIIGGKYQNVRKTLYSNKLWIHYISYDYIDDNPSYYANISMYSSVGK